MICKEAQLNPNEKDQQLTANNTEVVRITVSAQMLSAESKIGNLVERQIVETKYYKQHKYCSGKQQLMNDLWCLSCLARALSR